MPNKLYISDQLLGRLQDDLKEIDALTNRRDHIAHAYDVAVNALEDIRRKDRLAPKSSSLTLAADGYVIRYEIVDIEVIEYLKNHLDEKRRKIVQEIDARMEKYKGLEEKAE